ncbi:MAG: tetrahydrofolate dehydrogenase/cyclohydrolase catalytic domain-containing protein [Peptostreptococcaceae bacterium]|nr:tetrahydrofolate dehydrogenase/cyclohydrolase catalytic domain-containing protein [Peptostreptococcaceae bacterium]
MEKLLKGKPVADRISEELIEETTALKKQSIVPKLAILRVGERPDDLSYEKGATTRCGKVGVETQVVALDENIKEEDFIREIEKLNEDASVNGILIFRPLPKHIDESRIKYILSPEKDVDAFNPINMGKLMEGDQSGFTPCTPTAVMEMLKYYEIPVRGSDIAVTGVSMIVGKPLIAMLINERATVTVTHRSTKDLPKVTNAAEIYIVAAGAAKFIKEDSVGEGAIVIDVGINVDEEGKLCGDVDFERVEKKASRITPVPGGVGSVTTTILAKHTIKACKQQHRK